MECETEPTAPVKTCRHCGERKVSRPRGLCWNCYYAPGVRDRFAITSKYAPTRFTAEPPLDPAPTKEEPGSFGKLEVLERRAALGLALWHPDDAKAEEAM
jgi:hypothetical protein